MGESTGRIVFINSHDYVSVVTGTPAIGCMASLRTDGGSEVVLYTASLRLQHTLEMAFATKTRVTVDYFDADASPTERRGGEPPSSFLGPFNLKAMWPLECPGAVLTRLDAYPPTAASAARDSSCSPILSRQFRRCPRWRV